MKIENKSLCDDFIYRNFFVMNLLCVTFVLMVVTSQVLHCHGNSCWSPPFVWGPVCKYVSYRYWYNRHANSCYLRSNVYP